MITGLFEYKEKNYYIDDNFNYKLKLMDSSVLTIVNDINKINKSSKKTKDKSTNNDCNKSFIEKKTLHVCRH